MIALPAPLTDRAREKLARAVERSNVTWDQIEAWLGEGSACLWEIAGGEAYAVTLASGNEVEGLLAGGSNARSWAAQFGAEMRAHPLHRGRRLVVNGRAGWKRLLPDWQEVDGELRLD